MFDAMVYFLANDTPIDSARRYFHQQRELCDAILAEIAVADEQIQTLVGGSPNRMQRTLVEARVTNLPEPWMDLQSFSSYHQNATPTKAKQKFLRIVDLLVNNPAVYAFQCDMINIVNHVLIKVMACQGLFEGSSGRPPVYSRPHSARTSPAGPYRSLSLDSSVDRRSPLVAARPATSNAPAIHPFSPQPPLQRVRKTASHLVNPTPMRMSPRQRGSQTSYFRQPYHSSFVQPTLAVEASSNWLQGQYEMDEDSDDTEDIDYNYHHGHDMQDFERSSFSIGDDDDEMQVDCATQEPQFDWDIFMEDFGVFADEEDFNSFSHDSVDRSNLSSASLDSIAPCSSSSTCSFGSQPTAFLVHQKQMQTQMQQQFMYHPEPTETFGNFHH